MPRHNNYTYPHHPLSDTPPASIHEHSEEGPGIVMRSRTHSPVKINTIFTIGQENLHRNPVQSASDAPNLPLPLPGYPPPVCIPPASIQEHSEEGPGIVMRSRHSEGLGIVMRSRHSEEGPGTVMRSRHSEEGPGIVMRSRHSEGLGIVMRSRTHSPIEINTKYTIEHENLHRNLAQSASDAPNLPLLLPGGQDPSAKPGQNPIPPQFAVNFSFVTEVSRVFATYSVRIDILDRISPRRTPNPAPSQKRRSALANDPIMMMLFS
ncbi:hypothetical protein EGW08_022799 [Elysia chlorotica]|uniref:Uncharacterized protein n=1 Tax=Elysia chlorotica TaxID=188477 RepID=A0A433SJZ3_ELYCH|nr:hypothetical protein EGW08_022799 [Elysia chlorotica]